MRKGFRVGGGLRMLSYLGVLFLGIVIGLVAGIFIVIGNSL